MSNDEYMLPNINDGRFFVSPILGCTGACSYCYLGIKKFNYPRKNKLTKEDVLTVAQQSPDFTFGDEGTIVSIGAWGDIFPLNNNILIQHSVEVIKYLLSWGNPVQIMSKNILNKDLIHDISREVRYPGQLLYSTTITTIDNWKNIEPGTASPAERLNTAWLFHKAGIPSNVLLKPFFTNVTGREIGQIADLLLYHEIDYCTLGVMYWSREISKRVEKNAFLRDKVDFYSFSSQNHLDCNGDAPIIPTQIDELLPYLRYLRERGITAFLKSSCVNSNILHTFNASNYYAENNPYCINCGNCCKN